MKIRLDFDNSLVGLGKYAVVLVRRSKKGNIAFNSGLIRFRHREALQDLLGEVKPYYEIYPVSVWLAYEPDKPGRGIWCPYCRTWNEWKHSGDTGYRHCPICNISDSEFHVKQYNSLSSKAKEEEKKKRAEAKKKERKAK